MSMREPIEHDDALVRPELRRYVEAARTQAIAGTCVTSESVQAGLEHSRRRDHTRRMLWLSGAVAVAASLAVLALVSPLWRGKADSAAPTIEQAQTVRSLVLDEGTHELEVAHEPGQPVTPLRIELRGRTLELVEGRATIEVTKDGAAVRLHTGVAAWIDADGRRTNIEVETLEIDLEPEAASASELAREADRMLAAGERERAIEILRQLVELHPNASQARAAVLDLARLLAELERQPQARCAFELYLERWPDSSITAEVEAQLARSSPARCDGLDPI